MHRFSHFSQIYMYINSDGHTAARSNSVKWEKKITVQNVGEVKESTAVLIGSIKRKQKFPLSFSLKKCNIIDEN